MLEKRESVVSVLLAAVTSIPGGCVALCRKHNGRKRVAILRRLKDSRST